MGYKKNINIFEKYLLCQISGASKLGLDDKVDALKFLPSCLTIQLKGEIDLRILQMPLAFYFQKQSVRVQKQS